MNIQNEKDRVNHVYDNYLKNEKYLNKWSSSNIGNKIIADEFLKEVKKLLNNIHINIKDKEILDIGCASGNKTEDLMNLGFQSEKIFGIDIRKNSIKNAKIKYPNSNYFYMDARNTLFPNEKFDFINVFTLFSSILDKKNQLKVSKEIIRILKPGGFIIFYDIRYKSPFNKNLIEIKKKRINSLFPEMKKKIKTITLLPPIARNMGSLTRFLYPFLSKISFIRTHYLGLIQKGN